MTKFTLTALVLAALPSISQARQPPEREIQLPVPLTCEDDSCLPYVVGTALGDVYALTGAVFDRTETPTSLSRFGMVLALGTVNGYFTGSAHEFVHGIEDDNKQLGFNGFGGIFLDYRGSPSEDYLINEVITRSSRSLIFQDGLARGLLRYAVAEPKDIDDAINFLTNALSSPIYSAFCLVNGLDLEIKNYKDLDRGLRSTCDVKGWETGINMKYSEPELVIPNGIVLFNEYDLFHVADAEQAAALDLALASANLETINAVLEIIDYVRTSDRSYHPLLFNVGGVEFTPPYFSFDFTPHGAAVRGGVVFKVAEGTTATLDIMSTPDALDFKLGPGHAHRQGLSVDGIPLYEGSFSVKGSVSAAISEYLPGSGNSDHVGYELEAEVKVDVGDFSIVPEVTVSQNDLPYSVLTYDPGLAVNPFLTFGYKL
ncbi:hypothetical protein COV20_02745 [Candidatus Woesearchaeota archaeon CG10_big_fil_rev_8_21_14_0_10_45_16]|nr:MAG: hypothetical protein COV20_02745 [Candidatus Woesearchaeota archaeon CG10_big_fil_rev_8_21_14_0_10_45_16]